MTEVAVITDNETTDVPEGLGKMFSNLNITTPAAAEPILRNSPNDVIDIKTFKEDEFGRIFLSQKNNKIEDYLSTFYSVIPTDEEFEASLSQLTLIEHVKETIYRNDITQKTNLLQMYGKPKGKILGSGGFGTVYKFTNNNKESYAVKYIYLKPDEGCTIDSIVSEYYISRDLDPRCFATCVDVLVSQSHPCHIMLVQNYIDGRDLIYAMEFDERFRDIKFSLAVFRSIVIIIEYLHDRFNICHNDLKPDNIMICNKTNSIKIIDFGLSFEMKCQATPHQTRLVLSSGTFGYFNKGNESNFINQQGYENIGRAKDMFALGHIFFNLISESSCLWEKCSDSDSEYYQYYYYRRLIAYEKLIQSEYSQLRSSLKYFELLNAEPYLRSMIQINDTTRITFKELIGTHWFHGLPILAERVERE